MTKRRVVLVVPFVSLVCVLTAAACASRSAVASSGTPAYALTRAEQSDGWRLLFDGTTTKGWRGFKTDTIPSGWKADSGVLWKEARTRDIVSVEQFGDFELSLEWRIASRGNAGLFYRGTEEYNRIYWSAPEYQLLDDSLASDNRIEDHRAGSAYGLYAPPRGVVKPANEWNVTRVVAKGAHVEHWLNGRKVVEYEIGSPDWEAKVKASKFAAWPNYGRAKRGHIAIQGDHNGRLELRNIKIRELK